MGGRRNRRYQPWSERAAKKSTATAQKASDTKRRPASNRSDDGCSRCVPAPSGPIGALRGEQVIADLESRAVLEALEPDLAVLVPGGVYDQGCELEAPFQRAAFDVGVLHAHARDAQGVAEPDAAPDLEPEGREDPARVPEL